VKFSTRVDVDAPPEETFAAFADFPRYVRLAEARGAKVDPLEAPVFAWRARFDWNGKKRELDGVVTRIDPPRGFMAEMTAGGLDGTVEVEVAPLDPGRSRVRVAMEWRPKTMAGRILLQSLKLVKGTLDERFARRVAEFGAAIGRTS
jgi:uncharacterized protein YndB with AHSA1/START domain